MGPPRPSFAANSLQTPQRRLQPAGDGRSLPGSGPRRQLPRESPSPERILDLGSRDLAGGLGSLFACLTLTGLQAVGIQGAQPRLLLVDSPRARSSSWPAGLFQGLEWRLGAVRRSPKVVQGAGTTTPAQVMGVYGHLNRPRTPKLGLKGRGLGQAGQSAGQHATQGHRCKHRPGAYRVLYPRRTMPTKTCISAASGFQGGDMAPISSDRCAPGPEEQVGTQVRTEVTQTSSLVEARVGLGGAGGRQRAPQAERSLWAAERPLDRTPNRNPRAPILGRASLWPRCSQPHAPLPRLSRRLLPGGGAPLALQQTPPLCRARPAARRSTPPSLFPFPGRGRTRGRGARHGRSAGRGARRVLPRAPAGVPAPGLRHSCSGSGAQAVPGGGTLESARSHFPSRLTLWTPPVHRREGSPPPRAPRPSSSPPRSGSSTKRYNLSAAAAATTAPAPEPEPEPEAPLPRLPGRPRARQALSPPPPRARPALDAVSAAARLPPAPLLSPSQAEPSPAEAPGVAGRARGGGRSVWSRRGRRRKSRRKGGKPPPPPPRSGDLGARAPLARDRASGPWPAPRPR
ncbi:PREDICTED: basic proline-rich protein-like [Lipotes vexillifer]|uniref:Basic proline-rich protein-like n=1 Tax=Lipotes vexillifer TaxID=118797 RepID=A0A340Y5Z9_LIPVE|nr:PREDICTED: basic proline-rich protein-like [Lipotes vexillifer]